MNLPVHAGCLVVDTAKNFSNPTGSAHDPWLASVPMPLYMAAARDSSALAIKTGALLVWSSDMNEKRLGPTKL
jgi:hypothetical protein